MLEALKPESDQARAESAMEDILRWADDGGKMLDVGSRTLNFQEPFDSDGG